MNYKHFIKILINEATKEEIRKYYPKIDDTNYNNIIDADPTTADGKVGDNSRNVLNIYNKDNFDTNDEELLHDIYSALVLYNKSKDVLKGQYSKYKDINKIENVDTFFKVYHFIENNRRKDKIGQDEGKSALKVFENDNWIVYIPLDYQTSIRLGRMLKASWCTASSTSCHMYNQYTVNGDMWIFKNKNPKSESDIGYQYARSPSYNIEFKNNLNSNDGIIDSQYWEKFKKDNPDLKEAFDQITDYETKFKNDPTYKLTKMIERYQTSKSPYIAMSIIKRNPNDFDKLNVDDLEMYKLVPIGEDKFTTLHYERFGYEYKHNMDDRQSEYGFNQFGIAKFKGSNGLFGVFDIYDKELIPPIKTNILQISSKGYILSEDKFQGEDEQGTVGDRIKLTIEDLESKEIYSITKKYDQEDSKIILSNKEDGLIAIIIEYVGDKKFLSKLHEDGEAVDESIEDFSKNIFKDSEISYEDDEVVVYKDKIDIINQLKIVPEIFNLNHRGLGNIPSYDSYDLILLKKTNNLYICNINDGYLDRTKDSYVNVISNLLDIIYAIIKSPTYLSFIKFMINSTQDPEIKSLLDISTATNFYSIKSGDWEDIYSEFDDNISDYVEEIKKFIDGNNKPTISVDVDDIFDSDSDFIGYLPYYKGTEYFDYYESSDSWEYAYEDLFNRLQKDDTNKSLYDSIMNMIREYAIENDFIEDSEDIDSTVFKQVISEYDDIRDCVTRAYDTGLEVGAGNELYKAYNQQYNLSYDDSDILNIKVEIDNIVTYVKYLINGIGELDQENLGLEDLSVPYNGFDGYDENSAYERFIEKLNELI